MGELGTYASSVAEGFRQANLDLEIHASDCEALFGIAEARVVKDLDDLELVQFVLLCAVRRNQEMIDAVAAGRARAALLAKPNRHQRRHPLLG